MTSFLTDRKVSRKAESFTGNNDLEADFAPSSPFLVKKPVTKSALLQTLSVLAGFSLAALILVCFLAYLMAVMG